MIFSGLRLRSKPTPKLAGNWRKATGSLDFGLYDLSLFGRVSDGEMLKHRVQLEFNSLELSGIGVEGCRRIAEDVRRNDLESCGEQLHVAHEHGVVSVFPPAHGLLPHADEVAELGLSESLALAERAYYRG